MKKHLLRATIAALIATTGITALAQNVAVVNGKTVPKARLEAMIKQMERAGRPVPAEAQGQLKDRLIVFEVLSQEAQKRGIDATDDFKAQVDLMRQNMLVNELMAEYQKNNPISDTEAKAEYDKFAAANSGKEYKAHHILVEKEDQAKAIIAQLKKGGKFEEIAKKSSKDPGSGANGGALDWANPSSYVKEFSEALVVLAKGKTTESPIKTQFGFHIIRLDDVRETQLPKFDDVKPQIIQQLNQTKSAKYVEDLRAKAKIE